MGYKLSVKALYIMAGTSFLMKTVNCFYNGGYLKQTVYQNCLHNSGYKLSNENCLYNGGHKLSNENCLYNGGYKLSNENSL